MKTIKEKYIVFDSINNLFWKSNVYYGQGYEGPVYTSVFTDKLDECSQMTEVRAKEVLNEIDELNIVLPIDVEPSNIKVGKVINTVELYANKNHDSISTDFNDTSTKISTNAEPNKALERLHKLLDDAHLAVKGDFAKCSCGPKIRSLGHGITSICMAGCSGKIATKPIIAFRSKK